MDIYREYLIRSDNKITVPALIVDIEKLKKNDWIKISIRVEQEHVLTDMVKIRQTEKGYYSASIPKKIRDKLNGTKTISAEIKKVSV